MVKDFSKESDARIIVDELLRLAGWNPADKSQVRTEEHVSGVAEGAASYEAESADGRADYLLLDSHGRPLAVIEAKRSAIHPYTAKQQALPYARKIDAPFIFLTNGDIIYFWDYTNDDARIVNSFYSRRDLERLLHLRHERKPLATMPIPDYYIRQGEQRQVRPYQQDAMRSLDNAFELGKRRFLIELPTGTGKTDLVCLYLKRLIEAGRAERILFLVDRDQLAKQAIESIQDLLSACSSYWLRAGMVKQEMQITVCLLQTMIGRFQEYTSGYYDVVVADECHRSIYGAWQTALTYFDAFHVGLTATPAEYIERNTFRFYHCKGDRPDFTFPIQQAFGEGYLVPYKFASGVTQLIAEGVNIEEEHYDPAEFERKWTNEDTNRKMMAEYDRLAWESYKDLAPGQKTGPGKSIVFAITKHHAARLAQYLNELHPECKGNYAAVITSDVPNADELIRKFKREEYPQVAVSVGMLDTGFDCPEVLHLVMCRRVRSPILYQQMRGRGTRTAHRIKKEKFVIYDFFRNHEYFNDSDTDVFAGTGGAADGGGRIQKPKTPREIVEAGLEDEWLEAVAYVEYGPEGERIDKKEYVSSWEQAIRDAAKDDALIGKVRTGEELSSIEETELSRRLNTPRYYFNEENLRRAYRNPGGTLIDFVRHALGMTRAKSREESINDNFRAWLVSRGLSPEQAQYLTTLKNRGIARGRFEMDDLFQPPLSLLNAAGRGVELFGRERLRDVISDMNQSVFQQEHAREA